MLANSYSSHSPCRDLLLPIREQLLESKRRLPFLGRIAPQACAAPVCFPAERSMTETHRHEKSVFGRQFWIWISSVKIIGGIWKPTPEAYSSRVGASRQPRCPLGYGCILNDLGISPTVVQHYGRLH